MSVVDRYPKHKLALEASFTAGAVYESMAYFERAAESYELSTEKFPKSQKGADALFNAGVLRQALGQNKRAIAHYQAYAKRFRNTKKDAAEVAFRVAVVHEAAGQDGEAEKAYQEYLRKHNGAAHEIQALAHSGRASYKLGQYKRANKQLDATLKAFKKLKGDAAKRNRKFAAEARYYQGELLYRQYDRVSLDVKPRKLDKALKQKMNLLEKASLIYLDVVEYGDPSWSTAALYRIGSVMEEFATSLREAPTPNGLNDDEANMYRDALDNEVITIEERAIDLYTTGYRKAIELKVYNDYTKKLRSALGRMAASQFPPAKEAKEPMRLGDRTPSIDIVREVVRDD